MRRTRSAGWMIWLAMGALALALGCGGSDGDAEPSSATGDKALPTSEAPDNGDVTTTTSVGEEMDAYVAELCGRLETEEVQQAVGAEVEAETTDANGCGWHLDKAVRFHLGWLIDSSFGSEPIDHVIDDYVQGVTYRTDDIVAHDADFGDRAVLLNDSPSEPGYDSELVVRSGKTQAHLFMYFTDEISQADLTAKLTALAEVLVPRLADMPPPP